MTQPKSHRLSSGFSLLEVLIAIVIMSVGLLALATLQIGIVRSSSEAKLQTVALNLALEKLEDLTTYRVLERTANNCNNDSTTTDSYQCIDSDATGETIVDSLGQFSFGVGGQYTRTWTVRRCVGLTGNFTCTTDSANNIANPATTTPRNEFKSIQVNVSWADAAGATQSVVVTDAVAALQPGDAALASKKPFRLTPRYAQLRINNPASESGVIPIAVGSNTNSAATNPKPEVIVGTSVVETRFDVLTYAGLVGDPTVTAQSRVETSMVGCSCDFNLAPASDSNLRGNRPTYWDGSRYVAPDTAGYVPKAGAASVSQSSKCSLCCRDHHDPSGVSGATFSPLVVSHPTVAANQHPHYNSNAVGATAVTTGAYREACRLIRVDGIFRVAPDLNNEYFGLLATKNLASAALYASEAIPDTTAVTSYQSFVISFMNSRFTGVSAGSNTDVSQSPYNTPLAGGTITSLEAAPTPNLNAPSSITINAGDVTSTKWSHARALYVDFLEKDAMDAVENAKANCIDPSTNALFAANSVGYSQCVLKVLPFTTINLTEIADWNTTDTAFPPVLNTTHIQVSNNDYYTSIDPSFPNPQRGKVTKGGGTPVAGTQIDVNASSRKFNSGLLDLSFDSISPADDVKRADKQRYNVSTTVAVDPNPANGTFKVNLVFSAPANGNPNLSSYTYTGTPVLTYVTGLLAAKDCLAGSPTTNNTCIVNNGTALVAGMGVANTMKVNVGLYVRQVLGTNKAAVTGCTHTYPGDTNVVKTYTPGGGDPAYQATFCYNYSLTSATLTSNSAGARTATGGTVVSDGDKNESVPVSFNLLSQETGSPLIYDTATLTFGLGNSNSGITKAAPASCTYQCVKGNPALPVSCSTAGSKEVYTVTPAANACTGF